MLIASASIIAYFAWRRKNKKATTPTANTLPILATVSSSSSSGGGGSTPPPSNNGFVITGIGQNVTGASPQQSYHTVVAPARVINLQATPAGVYPCSVTINGHTDTFNIEALASGYPAVYFNPTNPIWGITAAGTYSISITLTIAGVNYTQTTTTIVSNADLGLNPGSRNGFVITGIGQNVTGASPQQSYHTVVAPARAINLDATPDGTYSGSVTINGHTEQLTDVEVLLSGYPAVYFNPTNPVWGITAAGTYPISITLNIAGVNYTQTTSTLVTNADLGINGGGGNNNGALPPASAFKTALINIVKDANTGLYSDLEPDTIGDFDAFYYEDGTPYLNNFGGRKKWENVALAPGLVMEVGKVFLNRNHYPTYQSWLDTGWMTKVKVGNDYPNDGWILAYAQQDFVTA